MFKMSNEVYDFLKSCALIYIPALATLYFALCKIWGFPYGAEIVATCTAVCTCLGTILQISNESYRKEEKVNKDKA